MTNPLGIAAVALGLTVLSILLISVGILFDAQDDYMRLETKNAASIKRMSRVRIVLMCLALLLFLTVIALVGYEELEQLSSIQIP